MKKILMYIGIAVKLFQNRARLVELKDQCVEVQQKIKDVLADKKLTVKEAKEVLQEILDVPEKVVELLGVFEEEE